MKRIREYGIITGRLAPGPLDKITDVEGVLVAAAYIHNGFGKSQGLIQMEAPRT
ncbi:hypothetical protein ABFV83_08705 [Lacrimispora sp. BS-2]|uniref:Uncharacterized protein n=1 Tax=Lacrimispora sp. BS-2 TaxID=3151850 RepID=A0AAU7PTW2_9FIRM